MNGPGARPQLATLFLPGALLLISTRFETGGPLYPIDSVPQGMNWTPIGGKLWILAGNYTHGDFSKPMRIVSWNGSATFNSRLTIGPTGQIEIKNSTSTLTVSQ